MAQANDTKSLIFRKQFHAEDGSLLFDAFFCQTFDPPIIYTNRSVWKVEGMEPWSTDPNRFQFSKPKGRIGWGTSSTFAIIPASQVGIHAVETWAFAASEKVLPNGVTTYALETGPDGRPTGRKVPSRVQFEVYVDESGETQCRQIDWSTACERFGVAPQVAQGNPLARIMR